MQNEMSLHNNPAVLPIKPHLVLQRELGGNWEGWGDREQLPFGKIHWHARIPSLSLTWVVFFPIWK